MARSTLATQLRLRAEGLLSLAFAMYAVMPGGARGLKKSFPRGKARRRRTDQVRAPWKRAV